MEVYLVGGAVRDRLLGRPVEERDWVVVGSSPEAMLESGYRQVGRDFPVFLHPTTKEEYALARTERKTAPGHSGFVCHTGPDVSLEDDLERRDLTINAMAEAADGALIDPFGGQVDLAEQLLRHVSDAFVEDPLRVFRVARFAAQLDGFVVADETLALMEAMALAGELAQLSAERVWQELQRALAGAAPLRFFVVLRACNALRPWLLEFADLEVLLPATLADPIQRFAALGWLLAPAEVEALCARLKAPKAYAHDALLVARHGPLLAGWHTADARHVYAALKSAGAFRSGADHARWLSVVAACADVDLEPLGQAIAAIVRGVNSADLPADLSGKALGEALDAARIAALRSAQAQATGVSG